MICTKVKQQKVATKKKRREEKNVSFGFWLDPANWLTSHKVFIHCVAVVLNISARRKLGVCVCVLVYDFDDTADNNYYCHKIEIVYDSIFVHGDGDICLKFVFLFIYVLCCFNSFSQFLLKMDDQQC